jgi:hypothetical protein
MYCVGGESSENDMKPLFHMIASKQASNQASKQASKQASNQAT